MTLPKIDASYVGHTWGLPRYVAFIDILGFSSALQHINEPVNSYCQSTQSGDLVFSLWRNCLPPRETLSHSPNANYVQMSDSVVIYTETAEKLLELVCDVFGRALVWGVPIRCGMGYGIINHGEDTSRPGTMITFYGTGLTDAYNTERLGTKKGMRLFASDAFLKNSSFSKNVFVERVDNLIEYPWWMKADIPYDHFHERAEAWWTKKNVGKWFDGPNRLETERVFNLAWECKRFCVTS
jgi:hypothetical protein